MAKQELPKEQDVNIGWNEDESLSPVCSFIEIAR